MTDDSSLVENGCCLSVNQGFAVADHFIKVAGHVHMLPESKIVDEQATAFTETQLTCI
jgi:hypothetical protein